VSAGNTVSGSAIGVVREWSDDEGWGVIDSPETPGGCWAHFTHLAMPGFHTLRPGQSVELTWEPAGQHGYEFRAMKVRPRYPCPCCRYQTLRSQGAYEICPVCSWTDDGQGDEGADEDRGGPNHLSLSEARAKFVIYGEEGYSAWGRRPLPGEERLEP
jgi:CspA family cold shock protein